MAPSASATPSIITAKSSAFPMSGDLANHAFFWDRGVLTDIGTLGGNNGTASWISDGGQVIGTADLPDGTHHAFAWRKGKITDLGTVGGDPCSNGFHINSSGQVVGTSTNCHGTVLHGFVWDNGVLTDLNPYIGPDFAFVEPVVINDRGEILGNGLLTNGDVHAVVLKPDGDCNSACNGQIQRTVAAEVQIVGGTRTAGYERTASTPLERLHNQMRQHYHPAQPIPPRD